MKEHVFTFLKGIFMGAADVVPGVSGGTIAFITGIYNRLIHAISDINLSLLKNPKKIFKLDWALFLPLGAGIIIAILTLSSLITYLLAEHSAPTFAFFAGLILASAIHIAKTLPRIKTEHLIAAVLGFFSAYLLASGGSIVLSHSLPIIFLSAAIAICAMILPGISGSLLLLLLGQYQYVVNALHERNLIVIFVFILGALAGLLSFSRLLRHVLDHHKALTLAYLTGLMLGSLRLPFREMANTTSPLWLLLALALVGFSVVFLLEKKSTAKEVNQA